MFVRVGGLIFNAHNVAVIESVERTDGGGGPCIAVHLRGYAGPLTFRDGEAEAILAHFREHAEVMAPEKTTTAR